MPFLSISPDQQKQKMRNEMRARRIALSAANPYVTNQLEHVFVDNVQLEPGTVIAGYHAFRGEMDVSGLTRILRQRGHKIVLPVVTGKQFPLTFRLWEPGDRLIPNGMGILQPDSAAPALDPDILLVPLLAFDRARNRLGYGGGYYDRTITSLEKSKPIQILGIGYSFQEVSEVPAGANDRKMDMIVTEIGIC